ncbi:MAG: glycogen-binding domain-containing protein [Candidatus Eisenbacteria bacterium]|nr:glycogen-binding domain-containing protein [Candidatus Eisenbacteria bacterium]
MKLAKVPGRLGLLAAALAALTALVISAAAPARAEVSVTADGIRFTYVNAGAEKVFWVGAFNSWNNGANPMIREGDTWSVTLKLPAGEQQYKFYVDGQWLADPDNQVTAGEFGNSVVRVTADGKLQAQAATSNTPLNPKLVIGGRFITEYISRKNPADENRMELGRPTFDLDVNFAARMSDVLDARVLTNIQSEYDGVQFFRTRLNFDRGSLRLHTDQIDLLAFDNDSIPAWGDPLGLVGNIGIYRHAFGYRQQGMQARRTLLGADVRLLYADNFQPGGTGRPTLAVVPLVVYFGPGTPRFVGPAFAADYQRSFGDQAKNVLAVRAARELKPGLTLGLNARLDRGQNPGLAVIAEPSVMDSTGLVIEKRITSATQAIERWWAAGADADYARGGHRVRGGYLFGRNILDTGSSGSVSRSYFFSRNDSTIWSTVVQPGVLPQDFRLARDHRAKLEWSGPLFGGARAALGWELHATHVYALGNDSAKAYSDSLREIPDLSNRVSDWTALLEREWQRPGGRRLAARLALDYSVFHYADNTPWLHQFWFDRRNFWLDTGEHRVSYDRLVMLGGDNVVSWKPSLSADVLRDGRLNLRWQGTWNCVSFDTRPKYMENLFQATLKAGSRTQLYWDMRWAKYDDPVLQLGHGYVDQFLRLSYAFSPTISFEGSLGVDPFVLDPPVNEYAYVGRDLFLFARGANGANAQDNYLGLARLIPAAEKALEDERRIQLRAVVRF